MAHTAPSASLPPGVGRAELVVLFSTYDPSGYSELRSAVTELLARGLAHAGPVERRGARRRRELPLTAVAPALADAAPSVTDTAAALAGLPPGSTARDLVAAMRERHGRPEHWGREVVLGGLVRAGLMTVTTRRRLGFASTRRERTAEGEQVRALLAGRRDGLSALTAASSGADAAAAVDAGGLCALWVRDAWPVLTGIAAREPVALTSGLDGLAGRDLRPALAALARGDLDGVGLEASPHGGDWVSLDASS
jgi:hypothetical protein